MVRIWPLVNDSEAVLTTIVLLPGNVKNTWYVPAATVLYPLAEAFATFVKVGVCALILVPAVTM